MLSADVWVKDGCADNITYITSHESCWIIPSRGRVEFTGRHRNTLRLLFHIYTV